MSDYISGDIVPAEVTKAVIAATRKVGTLGKAALNPHGGYKYVSIDKFYETVAVTAAAEGLSWSLRETAFEILPNLGKTGAIRVTYSVDLMHESGCTARGFSQVSIIHPVQGAQTVGSAMSYADKVVMRQLFKVATGEKDIDADETDNRAFDAKPDLDIDLPVPPPPPKPAAKPAKAAKPSNDNEFDDLPVGEHGLPTIPPPGEEADYSFYERFFQTFIAGAETTEALHWFWSENIEAITTLKDNDPDRHQRVVSMFTKRKTELKGKK